MEQQLAKAVDELNLRLSEVRMGNSEIVMDSVAVGADRSVVFRFSVLRLSELSVERLNQLFNDNRDRVCAGSLRRFLDAGYAFSYRYRHENPDWEQEVRVRASDCAS
jgi:hypothetical protein